MRRFWFGVCLVPLLLLPSCKSRTPGVSNGVPAAIEPLPEKDLSAKEVALATGARWRRFRIPAFPPLTQVNSVLELRQAGKPAKALSTICRTPMGRSEEVLVVFQPLGFGNYDAKKAKITFVVEGGPVSDIVDNPFYGSRSAGIYPNNTLQPDGSLLLTFISLPTENSPNRKRIYDGMWADDQIRLVYRVYSQPLQLGPKQAQTALAR